jgi:hypothetical protein
MDPSQAREFFAQAKQESFETSTIKAILRQCKMTAAEIKHLEHELGPALTWDWLNEQPYFDFRVGSERAFSFSFEELLTAPSGHPIVNAFKRFYADEPGAGALVFKVFDHGRWVATNLVTSDDTCIRVVLPDLKLNILSFSAFFARRTSEP